MLCVSIAEKSEEGCLRILNDLKDNEMAEIRMDLISSLGSGQVDDVSKLLAHNRPKIVTCRDLQVPGFTEERLSVVKNALVSQSVQYVDLEIEAPEAYRLAVVVAAKANGVQLIVSYHNYQETPSDEALWKIVDTCFEYGADIAKIAVKSNSVQDSARVLSLYKDPIRRVVALAMGETGMITRVAAVYLNAEFTFVASDEESATAPGQLTIEQMRQINATLKN